MKEKFFIALMCATACSYAFSQNSTHPNDPVKFYTAPPSPEKAITVKQLPPLYSKSNNSKQTTSSEE